MSSFSGSQRGLSMPRPARSPLGSAAQVSLGGGMEEGDSSDDGEPSGFVDVPSASGDAL